MNIELVKKYIELLSSKNKTEIIEYLKNNTTLSTDEKNAIYAYIFSIPLLDMELPSKIQKERGKFYKGWLNPVDKELVILIGAYRSKQYGKFIRHLLHSFMNPKDVYPIEGRYKDKCCICGKELYNFDIWKEECNKFPELKEYENKEFLTFGSKSSTVCLCLDCLVQLKSLNEILKVLEGDDYLTKWSRK